MATLDLELIVRMISHLEEKGDPFYPVSLLAHDLGQAENEPGECACLTNEFVAHLLHLQDLECIANVNGDCNWGYYPTGGAEIELDNSDDWETPHCYDGIGNKSIIRPTAKARQLKDALESSGTAARTKKILLNAGGSLVMQFLQSQLS